MATERIRGPKVKDGGDKILWRCGPERKARLNKFCVDGVTQKELLNIAVDRLLDLLEESGGVIPPELRKKKEPPLPEYLTKLMEAAPPPDANEFQKLIYEDRVRNALLEHDQ